MADFMAKLVVWYMTTYGGTGDHDRVTTRLTPAAAPESLLGMQAKYQEVAGIKDDTGFTSVLSQQWIIMLACTAYNSDKITLTYKCLQCLRRHDFREWCCRRYLFLFRSFHLERSPHIHRCLRCRAMALRGLRQHVLELRFDARVLDERGCPEQILRLRRFDHN